MSKLSDLFSKLESNYRQYKLNKNEKSLLSNIRLFFKLPKEELPKILNGHKRMMAEDLEKELRALLLVAKSFKEYALTQKGRLAEEKCDSFLSIASDYFNHISNSISALPRQQINPTLSRQQLEADYYQEETKFFQAQLKLFLIKKQLEEKIDNRQLHTQLATIVSTYTDFQRILDERYKDSDLRKRFSISEQFIATLAGELEEAQDLLAKTPGNTRKHRLNDEDPSSSSRTKTVAPPPKRSRKLTNEEGEEEIKESTANPTHSGEDASSASSNTKRRIRLRQPAQAESNKGSTTEKTSSEDRQSTTSQNLPLKKRRTIKEEIEKTTESAPSSTPSKPGIKKAGRRVKRLLNSNSLRRDDEESEETAVSDQSASGIMQQQLLSESRPSIGRATSSFFTKLATPSDNKSRPLQEDKKTCLEALIQYKELLPTSNATSQIEKLGHVFLLAAIELKGKSLLFKEKNVNPALLIAIKLFLKCAEHSSKSSTEAFRKLKKLSTRYSELFASFSEAKTEDSHIESLRIKNFKQLHTFNIGGTSTETLVDTLFAQLNNALTTDNDYNLVKKCCISSLESTNANLNSESGPSLNPN